MDTPLTHSRHDELRLKLARLRRWLRQQKTPALVLNRRPNFAWITCGGRSYINTAIDSGCASVLVTPEKIVLAANNIEAQRLVDEELAGLPIEVLSYPWNEPHQQRAVLRKAARGEWLSDTDPDGAADAAMKDMRASLFAPEVLRLKEVGRLTGRIVEDVCRRLEPGWTEHRVAADIQSMANSAGARAPVCLVAADQRIDRRRHPLPTDATIRDRVLIAVCIERYGLVCSATRIVQFSKLSDDLQRRHEAVCRIDAAAIAASQVARPLNDIFGQIVAAYIAEGFPDEWRAHHQGGTSGYMPRETVANPSAAATLQPMQVVAWNPTITGTKSEDTILVTSDGFEWITAPGEGWPTIEVKLNGHNFRRAAILVR